MAISGGRYAKYSSMMLTGQRDPPVANILGTWVREEFVRTGLCVRGIQVVSRPTGFESEFHLVLYHLNYNLQFSVCKSKVH